MGSNVPSKVMEPLPALKVESPLALIALAVTEPLPADSVSGPLRLVASTLPLPLSRLICPLMPVALTLPLPAWTFRPDWPGTVTSKSTLVVEAEDAQP